MFVWSALPSFSVCGLGQVEIVCLFSSWPSLMASRLIFSLGVLVFLLGVGLGVLSEVGHRFGQPCSCSQARPSTRKAQSSMNDARAEQGVPWQSCVVQGSDGARFAAAGGAETPHARNVCFLDAGYAANDAGARS